MDPFEELEADHRLIEKVLTALESADDVDVAFYEEAVAFIKTFADEYHHEKEEQHLFPVLERRGILNQMGPIGVMLEEHEMGRQHVASMEAQIEARDLAALKLEGRAYAALLRGHIDKEDQALFQMGRAVLTPDDIAEVRAGFDAVPRASSAFADGL